MIVTNQTSLPWPPSVRANGDTSRLFRNFPTTAKDALLNVMPWLLGKVCRFVPILFLLAVITGCATASRKPAQTPPRQFNFASDTFAYSNGLVWEYRYDENGKWTSRRREPRPD